ncbi:response regulator transcription factor [Marispirochaeta sp.]|jgi:LuxR family transcriptional regulator, positive regulator of biofilm formation|uniref:response regulator transcription factor n=1 Tax=Marispirochaeta sp. TaxID=2038653 RepID=UPI0029C98850|nr:response regulator transcription factor [Marispirochaeta sp.]
MDSQGGRKIILICADNLSNQMLVYSIKKELDIDCAIYSSPLDRFPEGSPLYQESLEAAENAFLFLVDCKDADIETMTRDLLDNPLLNDHLVAFYNLSNYSESEVKALTRRVRGFFYTDDSMELFLKGVNAIFNGEVWISRQILLRYIMNQADGYKNDADNSIQLTQREQQILSLMSAGVDNEEISDKLCISVNTVKTHMYNIYKKIQVSNRLQAALWAARNL